MKKLCLVPLTFFALAGCGTPPALAPLAPSAVSTVASAQSVSRHLIVSQAIDDSGAASLVTGTDASGAFNLHLVWQAVPRTFFSRLTFATLDGASLGESDVPAVQQELDQAASDPQNARWATDLRDIALELGELQTGPAN